MTDRRPSDGTPSRGDWLERIVRASMRRPYRVLVVWAILAGFAATGVARLDIDTTTSSFLDRHDSAWGFYQESLKLYGGDEFLTVALEGKRSFDPESLRAVVELTEGFADLPGVRRVDSLSSVPVVLATPSGSLSLDPAVLETSYTSEEAVALVAERVRRDRIAPRSLVSEDEKTVAINLVLDEFVDGDRDLLVAEVEDLLEDKKAWVSGVPVFRTKVNERTALELGLFVPLALILVGTVVLVAFGRLHAVGISLATSGLGTLIALGCMGATGTPLSLSTVTLPPILLAVGSAYVMHVLAAAKKRGGGVELDSAIVAVAPPIGLSGLTTAIGFLAMSTVRVDAIRELGSFGAVGVVSVLAAALTLAPAILRLRPLGEGGAKLDAWIRGPVRRWLVRIVTHRQKTIAAGWCLLLLCFSVGLSRLNVETDIILWFPHGTDVRDAYEEIRARLSGITPMNVVVESVSGEAVSEPRVIARIRALTEHLEGLPEIGRALSVADPLQQIHEGFEGDPEAGLPSDRGLIEQYLLLLASVDQMRDVISDDRQSANILLRANANGSRRLLDIGEAVRRWWGSNGVPGFTVQTTGIMYEFARAEEEIAYGQIRGLSLAFGAIAVIMLLILRSLPSAAAALGPNLIPLAITYGFMGLAGIPLDAATVCMGSVALGIAVDDTVHVATGFRNGRIAGLSPELALERTLQRVLPALIFTTVAIGLGFLVLGISEFTLVQHFGFVTTGMVVLCLAADITILPVFLLWTQRGARRG